MARPLLPILWGFIGGILLTHYWNFSESRFPTSLFLVYCLLCLICGECYLRKRDRLTSFVFCMLAIAIGITRYAISTHLPVDHIAHVVEDERVTIEGFLYKPPESMGKKRYLYVQTTWLEKNASRYRTTGNVRITLTGNSLIDSGTKTFSYGDTIRTRLRLYIPKNFETFNYREYLRRQGIYLVGTLRHDRYILQLPQRQGSKILQEIYDLQTRILRFLDTYLKQRARQNTDRHSAEEAIQIIKAMTLGKSRGLSPAVQEKFRNSGLYHFLVVSGIHIGILVWVCHQGLNLFSIPLHYRSGILAVVLIFYAGLTGFHFPVLRAVIMALTLYFSITCNRIPDPLYSLVFAVGAILLLFPASLFELSFQLTVAATASILLFFRFFQAQAWFERMITWPRILRFPAISFLASSGAMIGVAPLLIYYFGEFSLYTFISTLLALPIVSLLLPASLFSNFLSLIFLRWNWLFPILSINVFFAKCLLFLSSIFPELHVPIPRPSRLVLVLYYLVVYSVFSFFRKPS